MAVKIRLSRVGANRDNCFRVVAKDTRMPREGRFVEILGWYDPKKEGDNFGLKMDRIEYWTGTGAQLSDTVASLVRRAKRAARAEAAVTAAATAAP